MPTLPRSLSTGITLCPIQLCSSELTVLELPTSSISSKGAGDTLFTDGTRNRHQIERWHKSLKGECIRPGTPLSLEDARRLAKGYVEHYNNVRLNSAIGYITPKDMLAGYQHEIQAERDRKLEAAREQRKNRRQRVA